MEHHTAFALRADYEGTVEVELGDGTKEERPVFGGALVAVSGGDFHVRDELARGDGVIVVPPSDAALVEVLDSLPVLKRVKVPKSPKYIVSPHERQQRDELRHTAALREIDGAAGLSHSKLVQVLDAYDAAQIQSVQTGEPPTAVSDSTRGDTMTPEPVDVDGLDTDQLVAVLDNDQDAYPDAGNVDVPAAVAELTLRAPHDDAAREALVERNLVPQDPPNDERQEA